MASQLVKFRFLSAKQVIRLHNTVVMAGQPTQPSMLESAVQSAININHYTNQHNLFRLAATLSEKIMKNHAFQDGNKRTALAAADMFLKINGFRLESVSLKPGYTNEIVDNALVAVCTDTWTVNQLGQLYEEMATTVEEWTPESWRKEFSGC